MHSGLLEHLLACLLESVRGLDVDSHPASGSHFILLYCLIFSASSGRVYLGRSPISGAFGLSGMLSSSSSFAKSFSTVSSLSKKPREEFCHHPQVPGQLPRSHRSPA